MKRICTALAAMLATGFFASQASAQGPAPGAISYGPGYATVGGDAGAPAAAAPSTAPVMEGTVSGGCKSGFHPLARLRGHGGCHACGHGAGFGFGICSKIGGLFSNALASAPPAPPAEGGTLAFPHHTFVRSPRDFFMMDQ